LLIKAGADVNVQDKYGETALDYAKGECKDILKEATK
jgi:ankyrin repeat protein